MAKVIAITNQKGGVGKTTTAINLAASLAASNERILLIDLDPQGNATVGSGVNKTNLSQSIVNVLVEGDTIESQRIATDWSYDLLATNGDLTVAEVRLLSVDDRELVLKNALCSVADDYDFILIDCPPSLNMLTINALVASDGVLVPVQCEYYALEGLTSLLASIEQIQKTANPDLVLEGLLCTMYDGRNRLARDVSAQLKTHFGEKVYKTFIPRNVRLAEAPSHGMPVIGYEPTSQGALAYVSLASEMIRRQKKRQRRVSKRQVQTA